MQIAIPILKPRPGVFHPSVSPSFILGFNGGIECRCISLFLEKMEIGGLQHSKLKFSKEVDRIAVAEGCTHKSGAANFLSCIILPSKVEVDESASSVSPTRTVSRDLPRPHTVSISRANTEYGVLLVDSHCTGLEDLPNSRLQTLRNGHV